VAGYSDHAIVKAQAEVHLEGDKADHWGGDHHTGVPIFVVSHRPAGASVAKYPLVTYVTDGIVSAMVAGKAGAVRAGRTRLSAFADEGALSLGLDGLFTASQRTAPSSGAPGSPGFGSIKQRCLERANVSVVAAMMAVLAAQRAYEANAKSVQAADEMLRLANNLERN